MPKILIIGGVAAGMSAAARLRRLDENAEIVVLERGQYVSYANCGLPYYIGDEIRERDALLLQTPESFKRRFNVDVRILSEAVSVNTGVKTVTVKDLRSGQSYEEPYDSLLLAPGGSPLRPGIPGIDNPLVKTLWTIPDTDEIRSMTDSGKIRKVVVVGGGFIGLEMAENLALRGIEVELIEMASQVMTVMDPEMAAIVQRELHKKNIGLRLNTAATGFESISGDRICACLGNGERIEADMILLSIGVTPNTAFLAGSGIQIGQRGHIIVDEYLRTNCSGVYAAGDAIEVVNPITGKRGAVPLAGPANKQGRIAADNIHGAKIRSYSGTMGTSIAKVFDLAVGITGLNEKFCKAESIPYQSAIIHINHHAGYYPGAGMLSLKLIFSPEDRRILGAQVIGREGVDKRIDVIATALKCRMTVDDLTEIEHAYAPPYSSAKDPVNMIGYVSQNILDGLTENITCEKLPEAVRNGAFLLDVRTPGEVKAGTIPGAVNIPLDTLRQNLDQLPRDHAILVFCKVGLRGYLAARILAAHGYTDCRNLSGGYETYDALACYGNLSTNPDCCY